MYVVNTPTPPYHPVMIHRETFKATSISLPPDLVERLQELSGAVGEPVATVQRQAIRCAYARGWTYDVLGEAVASSEASERCVVRLSLSATMEAQAKELRGAMPLSTWYRAALIKFLALHDAGQDRTIWNLKG